MARSAPRWFAVGLVSLVVIGLLAWLFAPRALPVDEATVVAGPIAETVQDQGVTRVRNAYVVGAPIAGRLERIGLEVGDRVEAGRTIVARLRPTPSELLSPRDRAQAEAAVAAASAAVAQTRATRARLTTEVRRTEQTFARIAPLVAEGVTSQQARDDADAAVRSARAAVEAADAELQARQAQLISARAALLGPEATTPQIVPVVAPATGYVTRLLQQSERVVPAGAPLVEIGESRGLEAQIEFLSQDAVRIRPGMSAEIYDWGGPGVIPAVVRRVEPEGFVKVSALGVEEHRVLVMLQFAGDRQLWSGMGPGYSVWGRVFLRREPNALKAPLGALVGSGSGWSVFRVVDGRARLVSVEVGAITDREAEIRSGLKVGDQVILFPTDRVRDGVRVQPRPAGSRGG